MLETTLEASSPEITVRDHGSFVHSDAGDGAVWFEACSPPPADRVDHFDMDFTLPGIKGKQKVMVRVNITGMQVVTVELAECGSGETMDSTAVLSGSMVPADFFLPCSCQSRNLTLRLFPKHSERGLAVKNVEIWCY